MPRYVGRAAGYRLDMSQSHERPSVSHPLHGPKRTYVAPAIIVLSILALVFVTITYLRYNT